MIVVSNS